MTPEAQQLFDAALKTIPLSGSFSTAELGARIGLNPIHAQAAARALSNAGILELGFDCSARFTRDYRNSAATAAPKPTRAAKHRRAKVSR